MYIVATSALFTENAYSAKSKMLWKTGTGFGQG